MAAVRALSAWVGVLYARYARAALLRPGRMGLLLLVCCLPALILDVQFFSRVRTGLQDLLPSDAPSVRSLSAIHDRLGGQSHLTVIAQSDQPVSNRAFIKELGERLVAAHLPLVRSLQWNVDAERRWVSDHGALLMPRAAFDEVAVTLDAQIHSEKAARNPLDFTASLDQDKVAGNARTTAAGAARWAAVEKTLSAQGSARDRYPNGYLEAPDGHTVVLLIWLQGSDLELAPAEGLQRAVQAQVAVLRPAYPGLQVAYNGEVPNLIEEHAAILADLSLSSLLVVVLVGALIVLYFRSLRAVLAVVLALLPGLCFTFAIGRITVGSLNSNTAFLGSIIAGNGINYPLLLLAYYRISPRLVLDESQGYLLAARRALPGTFGAAATASAAYAGLASAHFRGFSEFGWIGGLGMVTTWVFTFLTMPIAIGIFRPPQQLVEQSRSAWAARFYGHPSALRALAAGFVVLALALSAVGVLRARQGGVYEMNINALRNRESLRSGAASWDRRINEVFGVWLNPAVALVDDPTQREAAASALRAQLLSGDSPPAERVETIETVVPDLNEQARRLAVLRRAKRLLAGTADADIPQSARSYIDRWLAEANLRPISVGEVPASLKQGFRELGGESDRSTLVYPSLQIDYTDARNVIRFSDALARAKLPPGTTAGGSFIFMAEIIRLVQSEAPWVVLVVCLLVALALIPIFWQHPRRIPVSVVVIAAVALAAQAIMLAFGVRVNMFNFAAVPITIGVGSDYVVNLFGAMDAFQADARRAAARMGGAILLCSLTTVVGYLSLVFAQSGALRTFGWAAVLGEIMAVSTVLLVIPAVARQKPPQAFASTQRAA